MSLLHRDAHPLQQPSDDNENEDEDDKDIDNDNDNDNDHDNDIKHRNRSSTTNATDAEVTSTLTKASSSSAPTSPVSPTRPGEDPDSISRPSLYSHQPRPRRAPFEAYFGDQFWESGTDGVSGVKILEELKSDRLEGVYNLSFLLLAFALTYLFVRNVVDNGFLAGPSAICFSILFRDLLLLTLFILPMPFLFIIPYSLVLAHSKHTIRSNKVVLSIHFVSLTAFFVAATKLLFVIQLNPLLGVVAGIVVMIVALKAHSYVITNLLLAEETELRRKSRRRSTCTSTSAPSGKKSRANTTEEAAEHSDSAGGEKGKKGHSSSASILRKRRSHLHKPSTANAENESKESTTTTTSTSSDDGDAETEVESGGDGTMRRGHGHGHGHEQRQDGIRHGHSHGHHGHHKSAGVKYPTNVTLWNLAYFIVAPTLVYETGYPRSEGVRARYVLWHGGQIWLCLFVEFVLLMQFCVPVWRADGSSDRLWWFSLKLALPCFFMWLLLFWGFFHCALNGIAELTRFADRLFYLDWWNATDLSQFWRTWNMPVHEWCTRHLYLETVSRQRLNRRAAILGTFLLSAVFHEYVCFVAFRMLRPYMFAGMILQIPLIEWSTALAGTRSGNYCMWIMLFVGQSWVPLLYCRDYLHKYDTLMCRPLYRRV